MNKMLDIIKTPHGAAIVGVLIALQVAGKVCAIYHQVDLTSVFDELRKGAYVWAFLDAASVEPPTAKAGQP